jgi:hypothetical protein
MSDRHAQCDGEVSVHCRQELHTQAYLGVPTGKNPDNLNLACVEAMWWAHQSVIGFVDDVLLSMDKYAGAPLCIHITLSSITQNCFWTHIDMDIFSCFGNLLIPFNYTLYNQKLTFFS